MTNLREVYKCSICGNMVEVIHTGVGELVCCGQPMDLVSERTQENEYREKHVPVATAEGDGLKVVVGSVVHPMMDAHYIEWIEVISNGNSCRKYLKAGEAPEAVFANVPADAKVRAYCNLHGLWRN